MATAELGLDAGIVEEVEELGAVQEINREAAEVGCLDGEDHLFQVEPELGAAHVKLVID